MPALALGTGVPRPEPGAACLLSESDDCEVPQSWEAPRRDAWWVLAGRSRAVRMLRTACLVAVVVLSAASLCMARRGWLSRTAEDSRIEELEFEACSVGRQSCNETRCCSAPGLQCYEQDEFYAQCRAACTPGPDPTHWDGRHWSCRTLGERARGQAACAKRGEDCSSSQCCEIPGLQCFQKDESWATCKVTCAPDGPDLSDADGKPWTCRELGPRAPGTADWVSEECTSGWKSCLETACCKNAGEQCYLQNDYFAACKPVGSCPEEEWSCNTTGSPTPVMPMDGGTLSDWVFDQCADEGGDCSEARCCLGMDLQCYGKDPFYAQCRRTCRPGVHQDDDNGTWSCKELGPRSYGLAVKGFPSLFCFSVVRLASYEVGLVESQQKRGAGIFDCDHAAILTADGNMTIGDLRSQAFPGAPIVKSVDNTAGNTELFVHAWRQVVASGEWKNHAFTVKADADAVLVPQRLRWHLAPFVGKKMFVVNCPLWNMIYGAVEVFSFAAVESWGSRGHQCQAPNDVGEDKYMTNCMDFLGVLRVRDDNVLGDKLCHTFSSCDNAQNAAFHPFKDVSSWMDCWDRATRGHAPG